MMSDLTLDGLKKIMFEAVGEDESIDLEQDILDTPMAELGFDSLAVMDVATGIQRALGVRIPEDGVDEMTTPGNTLRYVNTLLAEVPAGATSEASV
jgi:act minimal PKS acyl carrier protein